ncbi:DUF1080 domain-containing protein [Pelagicoccus sp. SDUM812002]|uniref:3-keto-disaccharide hydrolase n=1 Tax=Pelagicoccus sp. SDUM812002 TaxID=3041266 RepID=UPI00280D86C9|nr:DUF1080 domain-containing protein [Pelagicoccus sp. SDUM812002]MDQ8188113.1 DUF1080 domain-containing protein [Pelagicoccus sp. SDUM812002]
MYKIAPALIATLSLALGASCTAQDQEELPEPQLTEQWEPKVPVVTSPVNGIPSDAIVLFDGSDLEAWEYSNPEGEPWTIADGSFTVSKQKPKTSNGIRTKDSFGDVQLHLEFRSPAGVESDGQGRGNSGLFFGDGRYETQILDSYQNETYANGQLGSIYKQYPPLANPARKPGEWSTYDIVYIAPRFNDDGSLKSPARITTFINGVLTQLDAELFGPTTFRGLPEYSAHPVKLPISLQDHGDLVSFRNIWLRELDGEEINDRTVLPELKK